MSELSRSARIAGLVYLASAVGVVRLMYVPHKLFVHDNAAATLSNIAGHESLFRWGIVSELVGAVLWLMVPLALYRLLKGVDQPLAALMVILGGLMPAPIFFMNAVNDAAVLLLAQGSNVPSAFSGPQREELAMLFLKLHHGGDLANAIFWGLWLFPFGLLVYKSKFLPRVLGIWLMAACFGWLAFSLTGWLSPLYEDKVFSMIQPLAMAELGIM